jgi:hypothetical protein
MDLKFICVCFSLVCHDVCFSLVCHDVCFECCVFCVCVYPLQSKSQEYDCHHISSKKYFFSSLSPFYIFPQTLPLFLHSSPLSLSSTTPTLFHFFLSSSSFHSPFSSSPLILILSSHSHPLLNCKLHSSFKVNCIGGVVGIVVESVGDLTIINSNLVLKNDFNLHPWKSNWFVGWR